MAEIDPDYDSLGRADAASRAAHAPHSAPISPAATASANLLIRASLGSSLPVLLLTPARAFSRDPAPRWRRAMPLRGRPITNLYGYGAGVCWVIRTER